ncbi:hypothetical protein CALCODRAFT_498483 [Calocera cornea HHB12733]|uniref:Uncharacterized protein n=1 Tax=Calocera cornea HHB12733 TaxID=1353952 RepID=A0A165EV67_9BASI|nr:hypothetical protein CALCODRAFT_498483 [Calocera cornea HHB12733]
MLTEIRAMGTVDNTDCDEKWSNVNHLLMELRKGKDLSDGKLMILQHGFYTGTSEGCDGTVPSRKRKRGHTDEDHDSDRSGEVEPARRHLVNPSSRDKETPAGQDLEPRPTKRRRSLATSSTSLAFVAGGAAVWLALGMDYGL